MLASQPTSLPTTPAINRCYHFCSKGHAECFADGESGRFRRRVKRRKRRRRRRWLASDETSYQKEMKKNEGSNELESGKLLSSNPAWNFSENSDFQSSPRVFFLFIAVRHFKIFWFWKERCFCWWRGGEEAEDKVGSRIEMIRVQILWFWQWTEQYSAKSEWKPTHDRMFWESTPWMKLGKGPAESVEKMPKNAEKQVRRDGRLERNHRKSAWRSVDKPQNLLNNGLLEREKQEVSKVLKEERIEIYSESIMID